MSAIYDERDGVGERDWDMGSLSPSALSYLRDNVRDRYKAILQIMLKDEEGSMSFVEKKKSIILGFGKDT